MEQTGSGGSSRWRGHPLVLVVVLVFAVSAVLAAVAAANTSKQSAEKIKVGLITKDVTNPFFVKMRQGATAQAKKLGAELVYAAGKSSSDNASPDRGDREHDDGRRQRDPDHCCRCEG